MLEGVLKHVCANGRLMIANFWSLASVVCWCKLITWLYKSNVEYTILGDWTANFFSTRYIFDHCN